MTIQNELQSPTNFRKFFWTPDYNVYGFACGGKIKDTMTKWQKEEAVRKIKADKRAHALQ